MAVKSMNDIRLKTCLIIKRGPWYLVGWNHFYHRLNWSMGCYDAWRTRDVDAAKRVAQRTGGNLMLFNPIAAQLRAYEVSE
jgi:hypothetical protein